MKAFKIHLTNMPLYFEISEWLIQCGTKEQYEMLDYGGSIFVSFLDDNFRMTFLLAWGEHVSEVSYDIAKLKAYTSGKR